MIKDIVVNLGLGKPHDVAAEYAISIAEAFGAHACGIAFAYEPVVPPSPMGGIPADLIDAQWAASDSAANTAIAAFAAAAKRAGISAEHRRLTTSISGAGDLFGRLARRFDLAVTAQAEPKSSAAHGLVLEGALFGAGRPVVVVPYIQQAGLKLDRAMVCWDGSRPAARAIADAMPFLAKAGRVQVVIVSNERGKSDEIEGADMGEHLARHGLKVEVKRIDRGSIDVGDALLSHAADSSADFMVMGGYGHSRLRQFVLGGVTSTLMRSMTVPVLMSH